LVRSFWLVFFHNLIVGYFMIFHAPLGPTGKLGVDLGINGATNATRWWSPFRCGTMGFDTAISG
jgi:hypothetical protein